MNESKKIIKIVEEVINEDKVKITVCKLCREPFNATCAGKQVNTPNCKGVKNKDCGVPVEITVDSSKATCSTCGKKATDSGWKLDALPFYDVKRNTYYCGCRGWE